MYLMKDVCKILDIKYETLKFYCNEGLILNVKRDKNNYRVFDEKNIENVKLIQCLRKCGMSLEEIKKYLTLVPFKENSVLERRDMLLKTKETMYQKIEEINNCLSYIDEKINFYDLFLNKKIPYDFDYYKNNYLGKNKSKT